MSNLFISKVKAAAGAIIQASKAVTAGTSQITVSPDTGYDAMAEVVVDPTPSTSITPSSSSPVSLTSGDLYKPDSAGYAIDTYSSVTPSSSGASFSSGMVKMSSSGYAYSSRPSSGYTYGWNSSTTLWSNSSPSSNFVSQVVSLSQSMSNFNYLKIVWQYATTSSDEGNMIVSVADFKNMGLTTATSELALGGRGSSYTQVRGLFYESDTSIRFTGAANGTTASNNLCIPLYIYGLK